MPEQRKIIHIDMDCFYAAVEMRDNPSLRGIPLAVGGASNKRGVISTCNYEARVFGIKSAMATAYALRLCPQLTVIPGRMNQYKSVSKQIGAIFRRYTNKIEPLSLDEAFLDVSDSQLFNGSATLIAEDIRKTIYDELALTASAGIAPNKFLAKICSDENKPNGQCVVSPENITQFVEDLPLSKIPGVGKVTLKRLARYQLTNCRHVREYGETALIRDFGSLGELLHNRAKGLDERPLTTHWVRKSASVEHTFAKDINDLVEITTALTTLYEELRTRLNRLENRQIRTQQLKLKFSDFKTTTIERQSHTLNMQLFTELLPMALARDPKKAIRLLGIGISFIDAKSKESDQQLTLF